MGKVLPVIPYEDSRIMVNDRLRPYALSIKVRRDLNWREVRMYTADGTMFKHSGFPHEINLSKCVDEVIKDLKDELFELCQFYRGYR